MCTDVFDVCWIVRNVADCCLCYVINLCLRDVCNNVLFESLVVYCHLVHRGAPECLSIVGCCFYGMVQVFRCFLVCVVDC